MEQQGEKIMVQVDNKPVIKWDENAMDQNIEKTISLTEEN